MLSKYTVRGNERTWVGFELKILAHHKQIFIFERFYPGGVSNFIELPQASPNNKKAPRLWCFFD
jgi:hypothetical protein